MADRKTLRTAPLSKVSATAGWENCEEVTLEGLIGTCTSFIASRAVELAAATTAATVPSFARPFPLKEFTASLCAFNTSAAALSTHQDTSIDQFTTRILSKKNQKKGIGLAREKANVITEANNSGKIWNVIHLDASELL
jgi:hypothetical protein